MAHAQEIILPKPGVMVHLSPPLNPPVLKGVTIDPKNPFHFDFILDKGNLPNPRGWEGLKEESTKLIKYFLSAITTPEKDLWVNLSPYEKQRIVPESFGQTDMGRDLLAQDYLLKQITASLIYPEDEFGKKFWKRVYEEAQKKFGTTSIPVNTFNKVWIVPEHAKVYEHGNTAFVVTAKLKVMLEEDYLSFSRHHSEPAAVKAGEESSHAKRSLANARDDAQQIGTDIVRQIVIPALETEVNEGQNFAPLRQVYYSLVLAVWFKKRMKDSILGHKYMDQNKVAGIDIEDKNAKEEIYQQYLKAFKKGVYNYIKEESDPITKEMIPRKYFSGGAEMSQAMVTTDFAQTIDKSEVASLPSDTARVSVDFASTATPSAPASSAMNAGLKESVTEAEPYVDIVKELQSMLRDHLNGAQHRTFQFIIKNKWLMPLQRALFRREIHAIEDQFNGVEIVFKDGAGEYQIHTLQRQLSEAFKNSYDAILSWGDSTILTPWGPAQWPQGFRGEIRLEMEIKENNLVVRVIDNGLGVYSANTQKKDETKYYKGGKGLSVEALNDIVNNTGGKYQMNLAYADGARPTGKESTTVEFSIPLKNIRLKSREMESSNSKTVNVPEPIEIGNLLREKIEQFKNSWPRIQFNIDGIGADLVIHDPEISPDKSGNFMPYHNRKGLKGTWEDMFLGAMDEVLKNAAEGRNIGPFSKVTKISIGAKINNTTGQLVIKVTNDGQGMPEGDPRKMASTKSSLPKERGEGLKIIHLFIEDMLGGKVYFKDVGGNRSGTTVSILFPANRGNKGASTPTSSASTASPAMNAPGGIDLTADRMKLEVDSDKAAISAPMDLKALENIEINGLYIKDIEIKPLNNLPEILGVTTI